MDTDPAPAASPSGAHQTQAAAAAQQPVVQLPSATAPVMQRKPSTKGSLHASKPPLPPAAAKPSQSLTQGVSATAPQRTASQAAASATTFDFSFMQGSKSAPPQKAAAAETAPSTSAAQDCVHDHGAEVHDMVPNPPLSPQDQPLSPKNPHLSPHDQPSSLEHQKPLSPEDLSNLSPFKKAQSAKAAPSKPPAASASPGYLQTATSEGSEHHAGTQTQSSRPLDEPATSQAEARHAFDAQPQASPSSSPFKSPQAQKQAPIEAAKPALSIPAATKALAQHRPKPSKPGEQSDSQSAVNHLQHIMQETKSVRADATTDSLLLDTLKEVPDDMPMPFSIEDRSLGGTEGAVPGHATGSGLNSNAGLKRHAEQAAPDSVAQFTADLSGAEVEEPQPGARAGPGQDIGLDLATAAHGDTEQQQRQGQHRQGQHPQHQQQQGQQQHVEVRGNSAVSNRDTLQEEAGPSGMYRSTGLPDYASGALDSKLTGGASSALPSFDLDAEMDQLEKQGKVCTPHLCLQGGMPSVWFS